MIEQITNSWLFEPFTRFAFDTVGLWYAATLLVMFSLVAIGRLFGMEEEDPFEGEPLHLKLYTASVMAPIVEEFGFRILPVLLGVSPIGVIGISVVWAFLHGKRWPFILVSVPLYVKMALGGMFIEMILLHSFHNTWSVLLSHVWPDDEDDESEDGTEQTSLEDIDDDKELLNEIKRMLEEDDDFDPQVTIDGTTYDSFADIPPSEVEKYFDHE